MAPFDIGDLLRIQSIPGLGPLKLHALISHFGSPEKAMSAHPRELVRVPGINKKLAATIRRHAVPEALIAEQLRAVEKAGGEIIPFWDDRYPALLKKIYDPPLLLYVLGELEPNERALLAIVGTRVPSPYGIKVVAHLVGKLVRNGYGIVSGLARGIDTLAHSEALRNNGRTIGVLGSGIDVPYPRENAELMRAMCRHGAVVSEFAMGTEPDAPNFPRRNRIVSGMTLGTIVVESARDGGAMITASSALDQNREVFAIPGPMFNPTSEGPHTLLREGRAKLVHHIDDILEELPGQRHATGHEGPSTIPPDLTLFEQTILEFLSDEPTHVDTIADRASMNISDALVALLGLECKRLVRQLPGRFFISLR